MNGRFSIHFPATLADLRRKPAGARGPAWRHRLAVLSAWSAGFSLLVIGVPGAVVAVQAGSASARQAAGAVTGLGIVPKPVSARAGSGHFTLSRGARIVAAPGSGAAAELRVAGDLAAYLRPATGYRLPTVAGPPHAGDIVVAIGDHPRVQAQQQHRPASGPMLEADRTGGRS